MRHLRHLLALLCLAVLGVLTSPARAATITSSQPIWKNRVSGRLINQLNRRDCLDDAKATFSLAIRGAPNAAFEIWAGNGCDQYTNRSATSASKTCTRVSQDTLTPLDQSVVVSFRDMVKPYSNDAAATDATCDEPQTAGLLTRTLYFIVFDPNANSTLATATWKFAYDIEAPPPPTGVSAEGGDNTLILNFTAPPSQTNLLRYHFYCAAPSSAPVKTGSAETGGSGGTDTGGTAGTSGTDTGGTAGTSGTDMGGAPGTSGTDTGGTDTGGSTASGGSSGTSSSEEKDGAAGSDGSDGGASSSNDGSMCRSDVLIPGQPPPDGAMECGTVQAQGATGGETSPILDNNFPWAVAVAAEDSVNNIGNLSNLDCATPKDIRGFYEAYRRAGGEAGGGYCSFSPTKRGSLAFALLMAAGAVALVRRRR